MQDEFKLAIPDELVAIERLRTVLVDIQYYVSHLNKPSHARPLSEASKALLKANGYGTERRELESCLIFLRQALREMPVVIVRTSQPLTSKFQLKLSDWFRTQINRDILMSFKVDEALLSGVVIRTPVHQYDFSLAHGLLKGREYLMKAVAGRG